MEKSSKEHLVNDIENRLDDFFGDGPPPPSTTGKPEISMQKLKSVVLSIDWEITESCLTDLIEETDALLPNYLDDRLPHTLLRMLRAVGRYIRQHKAQSHPDAIKRVLSVFNSIEQITGNPRLPEDQKKGLVAKEIAAFKKLKEQVEAQRGSKPGSKRPENQVATGFVQSREFEHAINSIEERLNSKVEDLKSKLSSLQRELNEIRIK